MGYKFGWWNYYIKLSKLYKIINSTDIIVIIYANLSKSKRETVQYWAKKKPQKF